MKTEFQKSFLKAYQKRITDRSTHNKFVERLKIFTENPHYPLLHDHALIGKLNKYRSFSITGDIRVIYYIHDGTAYFIDIGTHNQVY